jgi:hypothetical protein
MASKFAYWKIKLKFFLIDVRSRFASWPWYSGFMAGAITLASKGEFALAIPCLFLSACSLACQRLSLSRNSAFRKTFETVGIIVALAFAFYVFVDSKGSQPWSHFSSPVRGARSIIVPDKSLLTVIHRPVFPPDYTKLFPPLPPATVPMANMEADFFSPNDLAFSVQNTSSVVASQVKYFIMLYDLDEATSSAASTLLSLPIFNKTESFIRSHEPSDSYGFLNLTGASRRVKDGDHLCGWASVRCVNCKNNLFYWIYYVQGKGGWYSETKPIPFKDQSAFTHSIPSSIKEPENLFTFVKVSSRIEIKDLPRF